MENEKFTRAINDNLMNILFEKSPENHLTPEEQLLKHQRSFGLKVQSVALPREHELFTLKKEGSCIILVGPKFLSFKQKDVSWLFV
jgi:hypothetical protein